MMDGNKASHSLLLLAGRWLLPKETHYSVSETMWLIDIAQPHSRYTHHPVFWQNLIHHQSRQIVPVPLDLHLYNVTIITYIQSLLLILELFHIA